MIEEWRHEQQSAEPDAWVFPSAKASSPIGRDKLGHGLGVSLDVYTIAYLPEGEPWVHDFVEEGAAFPNGAHDDQVDAMTQALNQIRLRSASRPSLMIVTGNPIDPEFRTENIEKRD